jgi:hypothetical protein
VVFILALAWFAVGAPRASEAVRQVRAEAARSLDVAEIRQALQSTGTQPDPVLAELLAQAQALVAQGSPWNLQVAAVLTDSQRQQALALEPGQPPVPPGHLWYVEPELPALAEALLQRHGLGERNLPAPPTVDPWPGVDTRRRARGLLALIAADGVTEEQGHVLLHVTLDAMALQAESAQVERALGRALPEDVRTAVLEARYAARPGAPGGRP